jgi:FkbM family methyltransferase
MKMSSLKKGLQAFRKGGLKHFVKKSLIYLQRSYTRFLRKVTTPIYNFLAKKYSPVEYRGVLIPTSEDVFDCDVRSRFVRNEYEYEEVKAIKKHVDDTKDIIDLGASTGFLTVYLLNMFDSPSRAVAVEGNQRLIPIMKKVRRENNVRFEIEESAYHSTYSTVQFNIHHLTVGGSVQRETEKKEEVSAICLKEILENYKIEDFICIVDIEGGEADLINNELHVLEKKCSILFIEFHEGYAEGVSRAKKSLRSSKLKMVDNVDGIHVYKKKVV